MWIESMNSFEIQCITEGLQIDKASLSTKIQSQMDKTNDFYVKTCMTQATVLVFWILACFSGLLDTIDNLIANFQGD